MPPLHELDTFRAAWNSEADRTTRVLETLPADQYDFRPDPKGRSIGELAWHLSEIDACLSFAIAERRFRYEDEPPGLERPREVRLLPPGYRRVHELLHHLIHHRGQLVMLCRMAGGSPPGLFGPNREEMVAMRQRMEAVQA
jgi:uncharacterized damage-inducible protein DinB